MLLWESENDALLTVALGGAGIGGPREDVLFTDEAAWSEDGKFHVVRDVFDFRQFSGEDVLAHEALAVSLT